MKKLLTLILLSMIGWMQMPAVLIACEPGDLPDTYLNFVENKGQWDDQIKYQVELNAARLFLESDRLTYVLVSPSDLDYLHEAHHNPEMDLSDFSIHCHAFQMLFAGDVNLPTEAQASCQHETYRNYFIDNDPSRWKGHVGLFHQIDYYNLYNGIDLRFYGDGGQVKYDFIVAPGADANQIQLQYEGLDNLFVQNGNLHMATSVNTVIEQQPYAYQYIDGQLTQVPCFFSVSGNTVTFSMPEGYDTSQELIIDPTLIFASYTGATSDNWGFTATYDNSGHLYAGGASFGVGYPTTTGAFQVNFAGGDPSGPFVVDISISKFSPDGSSLIYSTYLGGSASSEVPHSMIVTPSDELIVYGTTGSVNFPTTAGAFDQSFNGGFAVTFNSIPFQSGPGSDIIVTKFTPDGSGLIGSTFIGGVGNDGLNLSTALKRNYADESRGEVFIDAGGNIYLASSTNSPDFPATVGVISEFAQGGQDACLIKLNPNLTNMIWGTYLGGTADDAAYSIKMDTDETIYVCGGTNSNNFPTTPGAYDTSFNGGTSDAWLAKISSDGSTLIGSTYLGTSLYDQSFFVDIDQDLNIYTVGQTAGVYPVSAGVYNNPNSGQYIHKLSNDLTTSIWSTTFGNGNGSPNISPTAFLIDNCYQIYVSGWGGNVNSTLPGSTTNGLPITPDAFDNATDGSDYYFIILGENASTLLYATFFGSPSGTGEHVDGGTSRFDKAGVIYQAVCAGCGGSDLFPTTPGAWSTTNNSTNCNLGCIKFSFDTAPTVAQFNLPPPGCVPYTVEFTNTSINATEYQWTFPDATTSTETSPSYTFTEAGTYSITLLAINPGTCNGEDQITQTIVVLGEQSVEAFPLNFCPGDSPALLQASLPGGTWSGTGVVNPATGLFNPAGLTPGDYVVTYTVGTIPSCTSTTTTTVTVNALPNASYTDQNGNPINGITYCITDGPVTLVPVTAGATITGTAVESNVFSPSDVPVELLNTPIAISLFVEVNGCPNTSTQTVFVVAPPSPAFESFNFCQGSGPALFIPETPGGTWSGTGIDPVSGIFSPIGLSAGIYTVSYTVGDEGCNATASAAIVVSAGEAGTMPSDLEIACHDQTLTVTNLGDEILDEGQELYYILHTSPDETAGTILAQNTTGAFSFADISPAGQYYVTYYVSAVAALPDGSGGPLLSDPCIDIAAGTPVLFLAPITVLVNEFCDWLTGDYHVIAFPQGGYPQYDNTSPYFSIGDLGGEIEYGSSAEVIFAEGITTIYEFTISDAFGCETVTLSESFFCIKTPVELIYFKGEPVAEGNLLSWATATETDCEYYTLWRSSNGQDFTRIANVQAAGTSITTQTYQYTDSYKSCAATYYQLSQTDLNGTTRKLGTISINSTDNEQASGNIIISPVPAAREVTIAYPNTGSNHLIRIFDLSGKLVLQQQTNSGTDCQIQATLSVEQLVPGLYLLNIQGSEQVLSGKLLIQR